MTMFSKRLWAAAILVAAGWCNGAQAVPVELDYSGVIGMGGSPLAGVNDGDPITFKVIADNGGASLSSQSWDWTNVTSATFTAGSYSAATSGPVSGGFGGFTTDASGQLSSLSFGLFQSGADSSGNTVFSYYMDAGNPIWFYNLTDGFSAAFSPDISNTSLSFVAATPLPAALPLFASGLAGLGWLARRRRKQPAA